MLMMVAFDRFAAAAFAPASEVNVSKVPEMRSVGMLLATGWRMAAGPAGQIDNRIGSLLRQASGIFCDHKPDCAAIRSTPILKHDEIAAARVGERLGALQCRARRRLKPRHSCRSFGGLSGSRHNR
jgi:hypothetical protein